MGKEGAKMAKNVIKMIKILILIQAGAAWLMVAGCNDSGEASNDLKPSTSISGEPSGAAADDPMKQLQDEGKLPAIGTGGKRPVLSGPATEGLSMYPPNVDPDQDNVPNVPIPGHPEIAVDNCPTVFNPDQADANHNGIGDACE